MSKICMFVGYYPINKGGSEYQAYLLAQRLRERCEIFYISVGQSKDECVIDDGTKIYALRVPSLPYLGHMFFLLKTKILRILEDEQPDVIYQRVGYSATGIAATHCKRTGCRLVWHIASERDVVARRNGNTEWSIIRRIEDRYREYGIRHADTIIAQAVYQNELLQHHYDRECDLIVGNWLPLPSERIVKEGPVSVIWVANVKPLKQPDVFVRLAKMLVHRRDVRFVMIGKPASGRYQRRLEKAMEGLPNLVFMGEQSIDEVNRILAGAHVFVNTSLYEGFPNTFIQAWLRHVPVVSLNVDPDNVLETENLGFHSRTFEGLAGDTERLIDDRGLRESIGRRAHEYALRHHSVGPNTAKVVSLLANAH